jgi:hypothetical protein
MIVVIQGTRAFNDYTVFLRAMGTALRSIPEGDKEFLVFSAGPVNINQFGLEFMNVNERSMKGYGLKTKFVKIPPSWIEENMHTIDYFAYFSKPKEGLSKQVEIADAKDVTVGVYRY